MTRQTIPTELGTEKIGKLLKQYSIPAIIAMTASSLYNMVDSIFIGQGVGPLAISGLALTFPIMNLAAAFGTLVGVGASTLVSMLLGQKNYEKANQVLGNVLILNVLIGVVFTVISLLFLDPVLYFFGASEGTIEYAREYMVVILLGNVITHSYFGLNTLLRASGHPKLAMITTMMTVILNTGLDALFIYVFDMGIRGAAIATVLSQVVALVWLIIQYSKKNEVLHFEKKIFRFDRRIAAQSLSIGMAPFLMNVCASAVVIIINQQLKKYGGDLAIGAYGIVNRLSFIFLMIVMGLTQAMQPIAGYNYGAKLYSRVFEVLKKTIVAATVVTTFGFLVGFFLPEYAVRFFTSDPQLIEHSARGMRITVLAFPIIGFQIVISNFFQSLGLVKKAIFLSLSRQLLFLIPCLVVLPLFFEIRGVWLSFPISDAIATIVAWVLIRGLINKFKNESSIESSQDV